MHLYASAGIQFPLLEDDEMTQQSSSAQTGQAILAAALRGADTAEGRNLADQVEAEQHWRQRYPHHFMNMVRYAATRSVDRCQSCNSIYLIH